MTLRRRILTWALMAAVLLPGCGEPKFENADSRNSLAEDRQVCAVEAANSPAAQAYWQNPAAHPDYPSQVFEEMNRCVEGKGVETGAVTTRTRAVEGSNYVRADSCAYPRVDH